MPPADFVFFKFPAEVGLASFDERSEIDQSGHWVLEFDTEIVQFRDESVERLNVGLELGFHRLDFVPVLTLLTPVPELGEPFLAVVEIGEERHDVLDDHLHQRKPQVGFLDGEQLPCLFALISHASASSPANSNGLDSPLTHTGSWSTLLWATAVGLSVALPQAVSSGKRA